MFWSHFESFQNSSKGVSLLANCFTQPALASPKQTQPMLANVTFQKISHKSDMKSTEINNPIQYMYTYSNCVYLFPSNTSEALQGLISSRLNIKTWVLKVPLLTRQTKFTEES